MSCRNSQWVPQAVTVTVIHNLRGPEEIPAKGGGRPQPVWLSGQSLAHRLKGPGFSHSQGHVPCLQAQSTVPVRTHAGGNQLLCLFHINVSLPLPLPFPFYNSMHNGEEAASPSAFRPLPFLSVSQAPVEVGGGQKWQKPRSRAQRPQGTPHTVRPSPTRTGHTRGRFWGQDMRWGGRGPQAPVRATVEGRCPWEKSQLLEPGAPRSRGGWLQGPREEGMWISKEEDNSQLPL